MVSGWRGSYAGSHGNTNQVLLPSRADRFPYTLAYTLSSLPEYDQISQLTFYRLGQGLGDTHSYAVHSTQ